MFFNVDVFFPKARNFHADYRQTPGEGKTSLGGKNVDRVENQAPRPPRIGKLTENLGTLEFSCFCLKSDGKNQETQEKILLQHSTGKADSKKRTAMHFPYCAASNNAKRIDF